MESIGHDIVGSYVGFQNFKMNPHGSLSQFYNKTHKSYVNSLVKGQNT